MTWEKRERADITSLVVILRIPPKQYDKIK
jgi:hypothetical protein